ncbi:transcription elongation factor GreA [Solemya pervernicosa gill symbiont]|uniref:Transcription elongation factor GreA n=2 Tax=Gammaproteobacteria incertae sedis TaxID=118884 RepID=A0A1T2L9H3_9GAMM|nr:transcription elongation factor GreA [Candidatus Reidiella endopervernicosa]OOZ41743.1 transcription elongation factor GreA [Solemya pervernicosa gill symbiont]QKQ26472.1 transcription elongation factor GreA [Candidatus Reidiella endopervernicosa]
MSGKVPMTVRGAEALQAELQDLKSVQRPRVVEAIAEARAHGDLKENAEYHAAREQQSFIEGRIKDIDGKLSNAQVIDVTTMPANGRVIFGTTIDLEEEESGEEVTYQIVGEDEADIKAGQISLNSPIARALIGKSEGDVVSVDVPGGTRTFEILEVKYI